MKPASPDEEVTSVNARCPGPEPRDVRAGIIKTHRSRVTNRRLLCMVLRERLELEIDSCSQLNRSRTALSRNASEICIAEVRHRCTQVPPIECIEEIGP